MTIVVIGGTGRVGSKLVDLLGEHRHEALAAPPADGATPSPAMVSRALQGAGVAPSSIPDSVVRAKVFEFAGAVARWRSACRADPATSAGAEAQLGTTCFEDWLAQSLAAA